MGGGGRSFIQLHIVHLKIMTLSKIQLSIPDIWSHCLYCCVNNSSCGCMNLKTRKTSSAASRVHLEVPIDFYNIAYPPSFQFMIANFIDPPFHEIEYYLRHPQTYGTIGLNPPEANNRLQHIQTVEHFLHHNKIKAIGECGLDNTFTTSRSRFINHLRVYPHRVSAANGGLW